MYLQVHGSSHSRCMRLCMRLYDTVLIFYVHVCVHEWYINQFNSNIQNIPFVLVYILKKIVFKLLISKHIYSISNYKVQLLFGLFFSLSFGKCLHLECRMPIGKEIQSKFLEIVQKNIYKLDSYGSLKRLSNVKSYTTQTGSAKCRKCIPCEVLFANRELTKQHVSFHNSKV